MIRVTRNGGGRSPQVQMQDSCKRVRLLPSMPQALTLTESTIWPIGCRRVSTFAHISAAGGRALSLPVAHVKYLLLVSILLLKPGVGVLQIKVTKTFPLQKTRFLQSFPAARRIPSAPHLALSPSNDCRPAVAARHSPQNHRPACICYVAPIRPTRAVTPQ